MERSLRKRISLCTRGLWEGRRAAFLIVVQLLFIPSGFPAIFSHYDDADDDKRRGVADDDRDHNPVNSKRMHVPHPPVSM